ncbi:carboxymuconolactone decarboxylase family protein [Chloroflexota bacterium]
MTDQDRYNAQDHHQLGKKMAVRHWGEERIRKAEEEFRGHDNAFWDFATEAWSLFARSTLTPRERSLCMVCILTCLDEPEELGIHIRAALANGATSAEVKEAILQCCLYAGMPKGRKAFRSAEKTLAELEQKPSD